MGKGGIDCTLQKGYEVKQCFIVDVPSPLLQDNTVILVSLHSLCISVNDDHLVKWSIDVGEVLHRRDNRVRSSICTMHL